MGDVEGGERWEMLEYKPLGALQLSVHLKCPSTETNDESLPKKIRNAFGHRVISWQFFLRKTTMSTE